MKRTMITGWLLVTAITISAIQQLSAQTLKEFFNSSDVPMTYLGVDFTKAKVLNDITVSATDIRDKSYPAINQVIVNEPAKFDFQKTFSKTNVTNEISFANAMNAKIDAEKIVESSADEVHLKESDISAIVNGYNFGDKKGIGVMFIMETMNKTSAQASMYVTFIDMESSKVLLTERMTAKAGGIGFRNYWAKTIYEVMNEIKKSRYKSWKANVG